MHVFLSPFSLRRSFVLQRLSEADPTAIGTATTFAKCWAGSKGPVRCDVEEAADGFRATFTGHADDVAAAEKCWAAPLDVTASAFEPTHAALRRRHADSLGLRILPMPWFYDVVCATILQQRVRFVEACRSWVRLSRDHGTAGLGGLRCFPDARTLRDLTPGLLRPFDIDAQRASTLLRFAREAAFKPLNVSDRPMLTKRLAKVPGIGPWTLNMALGFGAGDADAVPTGDVHLPHDVCRLLAGDETGTDPRMVELLSPYAGHRFRVIRLATGG